MDITLISVDAIALINESFSGQPPASHNLAKLEGCFSSYYYYEDPKEQVASIIQAIIKNHCFVDANKRTALAVFLILCSKNKLSGVCSSNKLKDNFIKIASHKFAVEEVKGLLFIK